jgi:hypothetical protein
MLDAEQIARYHRDGYLIPDFQVPEETLAAIRARHANDVTATPPP